MADQHLRSHGFENKDDSEYRCGSSGLFVAAPGVRTAGFGQLPSPLVGRSGLPNPYLRGKYRPRLQRSAQAKPGPKNSEIKPNVLPKNAMGKKPFRKPGPAPVPVVVEAPHPLPVTIHDPKGKQVPIPLKDLMTMPPTTTAQEDLTSLGQRHINRVWEYTQAFIAVFVVTTSTISAMVASYQGKDVSAFLAFICGSVVGSYFSRTNHQSIGGIGPKPKTEYVGR